MTTISASLPARKALAPHPVAGRDRRRLTGLRWHMAVRLILPPALRDRADRRLPAYRRARRPLAAPPRHRASHAVRASALDKPNTVLIFKPDSPVRLTRLGVERSGLRCVFLYLDRPQNLIDVATFETHR